MEYSTIHLAKTFSETPPAYGRQKSRIFTATGQREIQMDVMGSLTALSRAAPATLSAVRLAAASSTKCWIVALSGSSTRDTSSMPNRS